MEEFQMRNTVFAGSSSAVFVSRWRVPFCQEPGYTIRDQTQLRSRTAHHIKFVRKLLSPLFLYFLINSSLASTQEICELDLPVILGVESISCTVQHVHYGARVGPASPQWRPALRNNVPDVVQKPLIGIWWTWSPPQYNLMYVRPVRVDPRERLLHCDDLDRYH